MHFSNAGHDVLAVDSYLRRQLATQQDVTPLYDVPVLPQRAALWRERSGHEVKVKIGDLAELEFMRTVVESFKPDVIVHYAEQPSAPYSMLSAETASLTLKNNLGVTANLIFAVREFVPDAHIIKLGTMGEYGTPNIDIEEGWLDITHKGRSDRFLYPRQAGSLYHTTKIMDTDLLWFYVRTWGLRVTDLMQGPVYGMQTDANPDGDEQLMPFFCYDELFGTVLNRFVVQAAANYPLTVYGAGGQTRGYLNLKDTLNCVELSAKHPPAAGELRIFNQFTETFSVNDLAQRVTSVGQQLGLAVTVQTLANPRKELEEHRYEAAHTGLMDLGLQPHYLTDDVLAGMLEFVLGHRDKIRTETIFRGVKWA